MRYWCVVHKTIKRPALSQNKKRNVKALKVSSLKFPLNLLAKYPAREKQRSDSVLETWMVSRAL